MKKIIMSVIMLAAVGCGSQAFAQSVKTDKVQQHTCVEQKCPKAGDSKNANCCAGKKTDGTTSSTARPHRRHGECNGSGAACKPCDTSCASCKSCGCSTGKCDVKKCECAKCPAKVKKTKKK